MQTPEGYKELASKPVAISRSLEIHAKIPNDREIHKLSSVLSACIVKYNTDPTNNRSALRSLGQAFSAQLVTPVVCYSCLVFCPVYARST